MTIPPRSPSTSSTADRGDLQGVGILTDQPPAEPSTTFRGSVFWLSMRVLGPIRGHSTNAVLAIIGSVSHRCGPRRSSGRSSSCDAVPLLRVGRSRSARRLRVADGHTHVPRCSIWRQLNPAAHQQGDELVLIHMCSLAQLVLASRPGPAALSPRRALLRCRFRRDDVGAKSRSTSAPGVFDNVFISLPPTQFAVRSDLLSCCSDHQPPRRCPGSRGSPRHIQDGGGSRSP